MSPITAFLQQYGPSTAATYARTLAEFAARTKRNVAEAAQDDVLAYQRSISDQAPATVARKLSTLGAFYSYLVKRRIRSDNPLDAILHRPKVDPTRAVRWLTLDQQRTLQGACKDKRELALVWTLLHGLRISEVVGLDADSYRDGILHVVGKGGKSRYIPMLPQAQAAIEEYRGRRRSGPLFIGRRGRITPRQGQRIVAEVTKRGLGERFHPHALRHSFGTRHAVAKTGVAQLSTLMGHADPKTTMMYVHLTGEDLQAAMGNDPLAQPEPFAVIEGKREATG